MVDFIDEHRKRYGVEPICAVLPIAPSTYYRCKELERCPEKRSHLTRRYEALAPHVQRVWDENRQVYGAHKVWKQLNRELIPVGRWTVERLMKQLGLEGVKRGHSVRTTLSNPQDDKPLDLVDRQFVASRPNQLWVADITYVATWSGMVYVAFVTDVFSRYIVGWRVLKTIKNRFST